MMLSDYHYGQLKSIRSLLSLLVYPAQYVINIPNRAVNWADIFLRTQTQLFDENKKLKQEHLLLNSKLQRYTILESENKRLRALFEASTKLEGKVIIADLLAAELQSFRHQIIINKGTKNNAYEGQPVLASGGIIGQVLHTSPSSSNVLLITDISHALPIQIDRNGLRAIAVGTGRENTLLLKNIPMNADIKSGDLVTTSGLGNRFPSGYPVGEVVDINIDPGKSFAEILIKTMAELNQTREVLMVWPKIINEQDVEIVN